MLMLFPPLIGVEHRRLRVVIAKDRLHDLFDQAIDRNDRLILAVALARLGVGNRGVEEVLIDNLKQSDESFRRMAADGLELVGTDASVEILEDLIERGANDGDRITDDIYVLGAAARTLGRLKVGQASSGLIKLARCDYPALKLDAIGALRQIQDPGTIDDLMATLDGWTRPTGMLGDGPVVQEAAAQVLDAFDLPEIYSILAARLLSDDSAAIAALKHMRPERVAKALSAYAGRRDNADLILDVLSEDMTILRGGDIVDPKCQQLDMDLCPSLDCESH